MAYEPISRLCQFSDPELLKWKDEQDPLEEWPEITKSFTVKLYPIFPNRDLWPFTRVTVHYREGNNWAILGLLGTCSELTVIQEIYPRETCSFLAKVRDYGNQVINGVLVAIWLTVGQAVP